MTPIKQTVYLPVIAEYPTDKRFDDKEGYFFTPEQLNQLLSDVIKQALENAAEKADLIETDGDVDPKSITNTFEETYKKFEV